MINASISIFIAIRRGHILALLAVLLLAKKFDLNNYANGFPYRDLWY